MKITLASKSTNPAKFIWARTACHFRTATSFLNQYLTTRTISYPIASTIFCPLTQLINLFTRRNFSMITSLASSTHHIITYITLNLPALCPRTKYTRKATANKWEKPTKAIVRGTKILSKISSFGTINFF